MHILMISSRSDMGGGPKHLYDLTSSLRQAVPNLRVSIASPKDPPFYKKFLKIANHHLFIPHRFFSPIAFLKLLYFIKENNVSIIHSHGRGAGVYSRLLALFDINLVHTFHGVHLEDSIRGRVKYLLDCVLSYVEQKFICVSRDERKLILNLGWARPEDIKVIHNGINLKEVKREFDQYSKEEAREMFKLPKDKIIWGTLSRLNYQKGLDLLLANKHLSTLPSKYNLAVAGGGEDESKLRQAIEERRLSNVYLLGETSTPYVFLKCLDGYFSYSRWEGFPISVVEALGLGVSCLLSDVIGHGDFEGQVRFFSLDKDCQFTEGIQVDTPTAIKNFNYTLEEMSLRVLEFYAKL